MFDPDARQPVLRLGAEKPRSPADEISDIDRQMAILCARRSELLLEIGSKVAQAEPISACGSERKHFEGFEPAVDAEQLFRLIDMGFSISDARMIGSSAVLTAEVTKASEAVLSDNSDFWTHRHMAGLTPLIARTTGAVGRLAAAAAGEVKDPATTLRAAAIYAAYNPDPDQIVRVIGVRRKAEEII